MKLKFYSCALAVGILISPVFGGTWAQSVRDGNWHDGATWNVNPEIPAFDDTAVMRNGNVVTIDTAETVISLRMMTGGSLIINDGAYLTLRTQVNGNQPQWMGAIDSGLSTTTMNGGTIMIARGATYCATMTIASGQNMDTTGIFWQDGGTVYVNGMMSIGGSFSAGLTYVNTGAYLLNNGSLYLHTSTPTIAAAGNNYAGWAAGIESRRASSTGSFIWSGGNFSANYLREHLNNTGSGTLVMSTLTYSQDTSNDYANYGQVTGENKIGRMALSDFGWSGTTFSAAVSSANYSQGAGAKMQIDVMGKAEGQYDQLRWIGGSTADTTTASGNVYLSVGTTIEIILDDTHTLQVGDTIDIIVAGDIVISGNDITNIVLAGDGQYFSANIVDVTLFTNSYGDLIAGTNMYGSSDSVAAKALRLTYQGIPEPGMSAGLLGVLALAFVTRRRKK